MSQASDLKHRSKQFALRIIRMTRALPLGNVEARAIQKQIVRSGTSVGANYRAVCDSRSKAEFVARMAVVVEEINETIYWLELLVESGIITEKRMKELLKEANELAAIFGTSLRTAKGVNKTI